MAMLFIGTSHVSSEYGLRFVPTGIVYDNIKQERKIPLKK
jgi:hypothetical protein